MTTVVHPTTIVILGFFLVLVSSCKTTEPSKTATPSATFRYEDVPQSLRNAGIEEAIGRINSLAIGMSEEAAEDALRPYSRSPINKDRSYYLPLFPFERSAVVLDHLTLATEGEAPSPETRTTEPLFLKELPNEVSVSGLEAGRRIEVKLSRR